MKADVRAILMLENVHVIRVSECAVSVWSTWTSEVRRHAEPIRISMVQPNIV